MVAWPEPDPQRTMSRPPDLGSVEQLPVTVRLAYRLASRDWAE
jgi:hypothetical protein